MGNKDDSYYIEKALKEIDTIIKYTENKTYEEFISDMQLIDAVMFRFILLSENIKNISQEYKEDHKEIKWNKINGFTNGIVHEYGRTDYSMVYEIVSQDIFDLRMSLLSQSISTVPRSAFLLRIELTM